MSEVNGGFFVELGLKTNKDSFESGKKAIAGIGNGVTMLLGTVRNAVPLIAAGMAGIAMTAKSASLNASSAIGFSTKQYEAWGLAANKAGVNAQGLYSKMKELEGIKYEVLEYGSSGAAEALGLNLAQIGINDLNEFLALDPAAKVSAVFSSAYEAVKNGEDDWRTMAYKVGKVLGNDFQTIFEKSYTEPDFDFFGWINDYYSLANNTDTQLKKLGLQREAADMKAFFSTMKEFSDGEFGEAITPMFKALNEFFSMNKDDIKGMISDVASAIGTLADALTPALISVLNTATPAIKELAQVLGNLVNKNWDEASKNLGEFFSILGSGVASFLGVEEPKPGQSKTDAIGIATEQAYNEAIDFSNDLTLGQKILGIAKSLVLAAAGIMTMADDEVEKIKDKITANFRKDIKQNGGLSNLSDEKIQAYFEAIDNGYIRDFARNANINGWGHKLFNAALQIGDTKHASQYAVTAEEKRQLDNYIRAHSIEGQAAERVRQQMQSDKVSFINTTDLLKLAGVSHNNTAGMASAVINQTITINGSNDVAFDVKQQAYRGAQEGLSQVMNAAQVRMQLMPGLV